MDSTREEFLRNYYLREKALMDWNSGINAVTEKGIEKGIVQGAMQKQIEIASNLLKKGLEIGLISETTGLDTETIQSL